MAWSRGRARRKLPKGRMDHRNPVGMLEKPESGLTSEIRSALRSYVLSGREQSSCLTELSRADEIGTDNRTHKNTTPVGQLGRGEVLL